MLKPDNNSLENQLAGLSEASVSISEQPDADAALQNVVDHA